MTVTAASATILTDLDVDTIVIGMASGDDGPVPLGGAGAIDAALGGRLARILTDLGATGAIGNTVRFATLGATKAPTVLAVGVGDHSPFTASWAAGGSEGSQGSPAHETLRRAAGAAVRALAGTGRVATTLALAPGGLTPASLRAAAEGSLLGAYAFDSLRSAANGPAPVREIVLVVDDPTGVAPAEAALERAGIVAEAVALVRDLVNTPPSHLSPARLAEIATERAAAAGVEVTVLDETALAEGGYGGLLGVGQGSANPPRLIRLRYAGAEAAGTAGATSEGGGPDTDLALVGKGITFDSGGLSLKPPVSMEWMKSDMAGAASVLATVVAVARLGLPLNLTGWMPCAENMPSGDAIRPSDVITLRGGKRVEVLNTDAEGRLVLGDALASAAEEEPTLIVDVATLTGAQIVALGTRTAGVMGRGDAPDTVVAAAGRAGETVWPMPMPQELRKSLDSAVADLANVAPGGNRDAGMLLAAHFLAAFVPEEIPWAHVDIAGPSWNGGEPYGYTPKGGTGAIVRTLVQLAEDRAAAGVTASDAGGDAADG